MSSPPPSHASRPWHSKLDARATIAAFCLLLWLPGAVSLATRDAALSASEKRSLAPWPELGWTAARLGRGPRDFEAYWDDHIGLRDAAIRAWAWLHIELFGVSSSPKLIVGREGWLFFGDRSAVEQYRGTARFDAAELDHWVRVLEERRDWLDARGIAFLTVFVPNKHRVYGQYMPEALRPVAEESQLDQLVARLEAHGGIPFLDLRPALAQAARGERIYHKTDTHWNDLGAYAAYRAILARLAELDPALAPRPPIAVRAFERTRPGLGLAQIVGLSRAYPEQSFELVVEDPRAALSPQRRARIAERLQQQLPFGLGTGDPELPRAVVFHDSFVEALVPFLSESFSRVSYFWQADPVPYAIESEKPDLVVHEIAERFLDRRPRTLAEVDRETRRTLREAQARALDEP